MHYEPEPDACRALFAHLKTHAQATMQGLTASELEQAQVLLRLSHGALKKEKYGKSINHLRAYLVMLEKLEGNQDLYLRISILGGLCHRLIGHLKMLDGREEEEADISYAESSQRIKKVETSIKLQHGVLVLRDLRTPLELPRHLIAARKAFPAIGGTKQLPLLVPSKSPNHRPESSPALEIMAHRPAAPPANLPKPAALASKEGNKKHNAVVWSTQEGRPDPLYSTILQMSHITNTVPMLCILKTHPNGHISVREITNSTGIITSTKPQPFDERAPYASAVTTGKVQIINQGRTQFFPLLRPQTSASQTMMSRALGVLEVSCSPGKKGFKQSDLELLHTAQHEAQGLLTLWADSQKQLRRLTTVTQAAITAFWKLDYAAVLNHFEQAVKEVIAVELCDLYVVMQNPKRGTYELRLVNNAEDGLAAAVVPFGEGIAGCVAQTGIAIATSDAHTDSRYNPRYDRGTAVIDSGSYQSRCMLSCPIVTAGGAVIGVAQLTNRSDGKAFDDDDMSVMKGLSNVIGRAMEAAAAHEKQKSDWNQLHTFNADLTHQLEKAASELQLRLDQLTQAEDRETHDAHSINRLKNQSQQAAVKWLRSISEKMPAGAGMRSWLMTCRTRMMALRPAPLKLEPVAIPIVGLEQAQKAVKIASDKKSEAEFQQMNSEWKGLLEDNEDDAIAVKKFLEDKIAVEVAASTAARHALKRAQVDLEMSKQHEESATAEIATEEADKQVAALQSVVDKTVRVVSAQWALVDKENELENFPEVHNVMLELGYKNETSVILPGPGSMSFEYNWEKMEQRNRTTGVTAKIDRVDYTEMAQSLIGLPADQKVEALKGMDSVARNAVVSKLPLGEKNELLGVIAMHGL